MPTEGTPVVVDTSVISILMRERESAPFYKSQLSGKRALISFQTLEELWFGAIKAGWGDRSKNQMRRHHDRYIAIWPNSQTVAISAHPRSQMEKQGRRLQTADAWIAATALMPGCPLLTHNRDFETIPDLILIKAPAA